MGAAGWLLNLGFAGGGATDVAGAWEWRAAPGTEVPKPEKQEAVAATAVAEPPAPRPATKGLETLAERLVEESRAEAATQKAAEGRKAAEKARAAADKAEHARLQALDEQELLSGKLLLPLYRAYRAQRLRRYLRDN